MDSLLYGSASRLHWTTNFSTTVATSSAATTELVTPPRSKKLNNNNDKKYPCNCSATDQERSLFLPIEIMVEILCRLDARTLLKFKSVCKQWRALIEDPNFVKEHASRAPFLMRHCQDDEVIEMTSQQFGVITTRDGLILMESVVGNASERKYCVRNPITRRVFDLPNPHDHTLAMDIYFVPSSGCYKLISIYGDKERDLMEGLEMLTLGGNADEPIWRFVDATLLRNLDERYGGTFHCRSLKGVAYFYPTSLLGSKDFEVVSLDMDKECFSRTVLPRNSFSGTQSNVFTILYKDHRNLLYLSVGEIIKDELRLLVLEDYKKGKWAEEKITIPLTFSKENSNMRNAPPLIASRLYVWFLMNGELKRYSIKSQQMINVEFPTRGEKQFFPFRETLVTFKGMRSEEN